MERDELIKKLEELIEVNKISEDPEQQMIAGILYSVLVARKAQYLPSLMQAITTHQLEMIEDLRGKIFPNQN